MACLSWNDRTMACFNKKNFILRANFMFIISRASFVLKLTHLVGSIITKFIPPMDMAKFNRVACSLKNAHFYILNISWRYSQTECMCKTFKEKNSNFMSFSIPWMNCSRQNFVKWNTCQFLWSEAPFEKIKSSDSEKLITFSIEEELREEHRRAFFVDPPTLPGVLSQLEHAAAPVSDPFSDPFPGSFPDPFLDPSGRGALGPCDREQTTSTHSAPPLASAIGLCDGRIFPCKIPPDN